MDKRLKAEMKVKALPRKPYNFNEEDIYVLELLKCSPKRRGWLVEGRGKPTLEKLKEWKEKVDNHPQAFRIGQRLPNGRYRYAFCASDPYSWLVASIKYLEEVES